MTFSPDLSLYYYAGDFGEVLRRHSAGLPQTYGTHREVALLLRQLVTDGVSVRVTSFVTPSAKVTYPMTGVEVVELGSADWSKSEMLEAAVAADSAPLVVAGFPNMTLLRSLRKRSTTRSFAVLASSYNRSNPRAIARRRRLVRLLNHPTFEWVSNHGGPATRQLERFGVEARKLVPWDIPHDLSVGGRPAKQLVRGRPFTVLYVGSVVASKGVPDAVRALARLDRNLQVRLVLVGAGDLDSVDRLARRENVSEQVDVLGPIDNVDAQRRMREADLVVVPSRRPYPEGFPLTLFEAVASRTPIVCSDHPMFVEHMIDGSTASTFRAGDPRSLARAIERTLTNPSLYFALSSAAEATLNSLVGSADYREMILHWVRDQHPSTWIQERTLVHAGGAAKQVP